ncbi:alpha/beta hydrolase [Mycobacterium sp. CBMA 234]|uniref:alpha/beta fold hydrolase n=1 Tax=Mycolicibacterium sp. CBMA 234 TaxID=1918495 RepID=UPI0012DD2980|nr:alpha/beta hydrolase [Mycolicibacterium sp. CBMA 234]MUL65848.1 alpha/beta hydrolase [Mycolicibacterium sp. CBMA 234]
MAFVTVDHDVRLHVQDLGSGPAVVLISGFGLDHQLWDRQVRLLTEAGCRVLCVDQRGHGRSDTPLDGYDVAQLATDLVAVLDQRDVPTATVVGHSFGGHVAFRAAAAAPDRIARVVLVGSNAVRASRSEAFPFGAPPHPMLDAMIADEHRDRIGSRYRTITSGFGTEPARYVVDWLVRISLQMPSWAAVACYRSLLTTDLLADIPHITQPVLQIIGASDPVHSAKGARWLVEQLSDSRLVELPDCGHYPMLEAADAFDAALLKFLVD